MDKQANAGHAGQYLTFRLGGEEYGVEILRVQEIKGFSTATPIPNTPPHVLGVMNLRGTIIPVLDLRARLGMPKADATAFSVIVVVRVSARVVGVVVDAVSDVLDIPADDVQPAPELGASVDTRFIQGLARTGDKLVLLLALDAVFAADEVALAMVS